MLTAWLLSALCVFTFGILGGLYRHAPTDVTPGWVFWIIVPIVATLFLAALLIALKSMVRKQGGLALFITTLVVSIVGFLAAFPTMMILSMLVSGNMN